MPAARNFSAVALCAVCLFASVAAAGGGEWLGGQYFGQISGCGVCGGCLYGFGRAIPHPGSVFSAPVPLEAPAAELPWHSAGSGLSEVETTAFVSFADRDAIPPPPQGSSRRNIQLRSAAALPQAPPQTGVKTVTHISLPERLYQEPVRIVAPNAWSDPIRR